MPGALEVLETGRTLGDDGTWYPTALLDVADRPDVADLARVHADEGIGDLTTSMSVQGDQVTLLVELHRPVRCRFGIAMRSPAHLPLLIDAAATGYLLLATTSPVADHRPPWLALHVDRHLLVDALRAIADHGPRP